MCSFSAVNKQRQWIPPRFHKASQAEPFIPSGKQGIDFSEFPGSSCNKEIKGPPLFPSTAFIRPGPDKQRQVSSRQGEGRQTTSWFNSNSSVSYIPVTVQNANHDRPAQSPGIIYCSLVHPRSEGENKRWGKSSASRARWATTAPRHSINKLGPLTLPFFLHPAIPQAMVSLNLQFLSCHHTYTTGTLYSQPNGSADDRRPATHTALLGSHPVNYYRMMNWEL